MTLMGIYSLLALYSLYRYYQRLQKQAAATDGNGIMPQEAVKVIDNASEKALEKRSVE